MAGIVSEHTPSYKDWLGPALGAGAAGLPLLFGGGGGDVGAALSKLTRSADQANQVGIDATAQGADMFRSVMPYIKALAGGDQAAINAATMPERRRVIDQYDTARRSIAAFTPRGGGQATAMNELRGKEAGDLATLAGGARKEGVSQAADIGHILSSLGLNASSISAQTQAAIANILERQQESKAQGWGQFGEAIGSIIAMALL